MIPIDKQYHFIVGLCIYTISSLFMPTLWAIIPVIIIGTLKEVYDYISKKGTPEINDLLYTIYGAITLLIIKLILQ
jgi:hypothetical protein